mgnify:CR=1 FL=1
MRQGLPDRRNHVVISCDFDQYMWKPNAAGCLADQLTGFIDRRGITQLVFMGVTTEVCVQTSMREANDRGYDCLLLEDCTESYFPHFKAATVEMLRAQGAIVGWTASSAQLIAALQGA